MRYKARHRLSRWEYIKFSLRFAWEVNMAALA